MSLRQNALLLTVLTVLIAIAGDWSSSAAFSGAWRLPVALLLLGLAYESWCVARVQFTAALQPRGRIALGQPVQLELTLQQSAARAATLEIAIDAPESADMAADVHTLSFDGVGEAVAMRVSMTPRRLGSQAWPALRIRVAGPLGLAWWSRRLPVAFEMRVVPDLLRRVATAAGAANSGVQSRPIVGAGAEILQLRDYRIGDPQNLIDWKAVARTGRMVTRDFSEDQHLEIVIAVDAGRTAALRAGRLDRLGHYANLAARFAEYAIANDDRVGLIVFADRPLAVLPPGRGIGTVLNIRALLAATTLAQAESNPLNAAVRIRSLVRHRSLVVLLTDLDDATVAGQLASAARLLLPKHLPLIAGLASPEAEALRDAEARAWLDPYESLAAQDYCARLERNVRALRALGAPALIAPPEQLESAVFGAYADFRRRRRI